MQATKVAEPSCLVRWRTVRMWLWIALRRYSTGCETIEIFRPDASSGAGGTPPLGTPPGLPPCLSHGAYAFSKFDGNGLHYKDSVKSYSTVEPAIDYTSSSLLMFARRAAGAPSSTISVLSRREQVSIK